MTTLKGSYDQYQRLGTRFRMQHISTKQLSEGLLSIFKSSDEVLIEQPMVDAKDCIFGHKSPEWRRLALHDYFGNTAITYAIVVLYKLRPCTFSNLVSP